MFAGVCLSTGRLSGPEVCVPGLGVPGLGVPAPGGCLLLAEGGTCSLLDAWLRPPLLDGHCSRQYASHWNAFLLQ